jgi:hypothetical protein
VQSGGGASGFCGQASQAGLTLRKEIQGIAASATSEPSKIKSELDATLSTLKGIQSSAPSAIQSDIGVYVDYMTQLQGVLAKHNYSFMASVADLRKLQANEGKLNSATSHIKAWAKANGCVH